MKQPILIVDDEQEMCELFELSLADEYAVTCCTSPRSALDAVTSSDFAAVLTDVGMTEMTGLELCHRVLEVRPGLPVVVVTGQGHVDTAISAMRAGAFDFVTKPVDPKLLSLAVGRAVRHGELHHELARLRASSHSETPKPAGVLGDSKPMRKVYEVIQRLAESDASVLLHGETGTGKELVARAIHATSQRKAGPFVAINCAAVPHTLLESELFGHARGAFTDAKAARRGLFVQANGGTLFLDEIGEMPSEVQAKLLRALQERKVRPVGSEEEVPYDARILAATNRDLEYEVHKKRFREDLFYRINVVSLTMPPLRDRGRDILTLAQHFLDGFARQNHREDFTISQQAAEKLLAYAWPGNVRELENCIERAVALARFNTLTVEDLPSKMRQRGDERVLVCADDRTDLVSMDEVERRYVLQVLSLVGGNKSQAALVLGFDRRTLYRKLERYEALPHGGSTDS